MLGVNFDTILDEDHTAAIHEDQVRAGQLVIYLDTDFAGADTAPRECGISGEVG